VEQAGETLFARTRADERQWPENVRTLLVPEHNGRLDLVVLMMLLGKQQINSIWVEAGPPLPARCCRPGWWTSLSSILRLNC
jgi:diaminohydroxyphosphoribosylaminopyrimidine deaminase/5-amino-6-(5-phosphoribosylamino)uracil reductase